MAGLEPAKIEIYGTGDEPDVVEVLFNPNQYTITRNAHYAEIKVPGLNEPLLQFVRGNTRTLKVDLFLDRTNDRRQDLEADLVQLRRMVEVDGELHAPPVVRFVWGTTRFTGVVGEFTEIFQLFDRRGHTQRAKIELLLKSYQPVEEQLRDPERGSPDRTRTWVVAEGDRLDQIAAREYGDPAVWRQIAEANGIDRLRAIEPGRVLILPAI